MLDIYYVRYYGDNNDLFMYNDIFMFNYKWQ